MGRGSTQILIREILKSISQSPKSIKEIIDNTKLDRTAVTRYLNLLTDSGILLEESSETNKKYRLVPAYRSDTYFGLPLTPSEEKEAYSLFYSIRKYWYALTKKTLLRTHAQKIAYKVITQCNLKIPCGWYLYGGIGVLSYDDSKEYTYSGLSKPIENCIKQVTEEYAKTEQAWQIKKQQYLEENKELYQIKEKILAIFYSDNFDKHPKSSMIMAIKLTRKLIGHMPKIENKSFHEIMDSYFDLMLDIHNKFEDNLSMERKREVITLFEAIWKYLALFNFKNDLSKYYSEKLLNLHFTIDIIQQEDEIIELGTALQSLIPEEEIKDPLRKELNLALAKIQKLNLEGQKFQKEKLETMEKELGHEKTQKELLKQVGL